MIVRSGIYLLALLCFASAAAANPPVLFLPAGNGCTMVFSDGQSQGRTHSAPEGCSGSVDLCSPEFAQLDVARHALGLGSCTDRGDSKFSMSQTSAKIDYVVLVDDRNMPLDMLSRFQQAVVPVQGTSVIGPAIISRNGTTSLWIGLQYPSLSRMKPGEWPDLVRWVVSDFGNTGESVGVGGKPVCDPGTDRGSIDEAKESLATIARDYTWARQQALRELGLDLEGNQVESKFDYTKEIGSAVANEVLGVSLKQAEKHIGSALGAGGGSAAASAGGPALMVLQSAFKVIETVHSSHKENEAANKEAREARAQADAQRDLGREGFAAATGTNPVRIGREIGRRYCVLKGEARDGFVAALDRLGDIVEQGRHLPGSPDALHDVLAFHTIEAYVRNVRVEGGGNGHIKVVYKYRHDEGDDRYRFKQESSTLVAPMGANLAQRFDELLPAAHPDANPKHIFLIDVPKQICTVGFFWTEGAPGETAEKCGSLSRDNQDVQSESIQVFHHNAQERLFRDRRTWMEEWTGFEDDWDDDYR